MLPAHTHGKRQSHLSKHKDKRCKWNGAKKPPYTLRKRPDTYSWLCKVSGKRKWWERRGGRTRALEAALRWDHLWKWLLSQWLLGNQTPLALWARKGDQSSGGSEAAKELRELPPYSQAHQVASDNSRNCHWMSILIHIFFLKALNFPFSQRK